MSTPSPAIATVNGFPSCSIAFMVAISPDGITRTYQKIQMNFFSHPYGSTDKPQLCLAWEPSINEVEPEMPSWINFMQKSARV
jgi:hypothetical protein